MRKKNPRYAKLLRQFKLEVYRVVKRDCWYYYVDGTKALIDKSVIPYRKHIAISATRMAYLWGCHSSTAHTRLKDFVKNGDCIKSIATKGWYAIPSEDVSEIMLRYIKKEEVKQRGD